MSPVETSYLVLVLVGRIGFAARWPITRPSETIK